MKYRSSETNYQYGYGHKCIYGCLLTASRVVAVVGLFVFVFNVIFFIGATC